MRRYLFPTAFACLAFGLIALLAFGLQHQGGENLSLDSQIAHGHLPPAPDATVKLPLLGSSRRSDIAAYRGRVVVVNIFASWCTPCQAEAPTLRREQQRLARSGGTILGITYKDAPGDSEQYMRSNRLSYPVLRDVNGTVAQSSGTDGVPETFVLDARGQVVAIRRFPVTLAWLAGAVHTALVDSHAA